MRNLRIPKLLYFCRKISDMKVKMFIRNQCCSYHYYLEAEFPCAPRIGDIVSANWDPLKEAIIENDDLFDYHEYLPNELAEWYLNPEAQKTKSKPTKEQLWKGLCFDTLGKVASVCWVVSDGEAQCQIDIEDLEAHDS